MGYLVLKHKDFRIIMIASILKYVKYGMSEEAAVKGDSKFLLHCLEFTLGQPSRSPRPFLESTS